MQQKDKKRLNLYKGIHKKTRSLMREIHEITKDFRAKGMNYNIPMIARALKKNSDSRSDYGEIANALNSAREIAKEVLKLMSRVFIDENGRHVREFIDFKGGVLTIQQAEKQFVDLLEAHKIPYEYYDFVQGTLIPMTSFVVKESIDQDRIKRAAFHAETVLEDMAILNEKIQITGKTARESLLPVKEVHKDYLIDGLTPKKSQKNIWEKEHSRKLIGQKTKELLQNIDDAELKRLEHEIAKRREEISKKRLKDKVENNKK